MSDESVVQHIGAVTPPMKVEVSRNAKGDMQWLVSAHCDTMGEAINIVRATVAEMNLAYPRKETP